MGFFVWNCLVVGLIVIGRLDRMRGDNVPSDKQRVAICIGGQRGRWLPSFLFDNLINANPEQDYFLFFNIQEHNSSAEVLFSSGPSFQSSKMVYFNDGETSDHLRSLQNNSKHSRIVSVQNTTGKSYSFWSNTVKSELDLFSHPMFAPRFQSNVNIMNMYQSQVICSKQIQEYEKRMSNKKSHWRFDFIISTREDIYFFKPLNMSKLLNLIRASPNYPSQTSLSHCDLLSSACFTWGGLNMRIFIMNREAGLLMLGRRFQFYTELKHKKVKLYNPETFEMMQAASNHLHVCPIKVDSLPIAVARHTQNGEFCFRGFEMRRCYPRTDFPACEKLAEFAVVKDHINEKISIL